MAQVLPELGSGVAGKPETGDMSALPSVSVIVPAFNEDRTVGELLRRLLLVSGGRWQIIVVNDGSTDGTATVLDQFKEIDGIQILGHATNRGKGAAVRAGLEIATGDVVVIQDADLEYDPADLNGLIERFRDPQVQAVYGIRYGPHALAHQPWTIFRFAVALLNGLVWLLYGRRLHDEATCYKIVRRPLLAEMNLHSNRFELCAEITAKLCRWGVPIEECPISYDPRGSAEGKKIGISAFGRCVTELIRWRFAGRALVAGDFHEAD